MAREGGRDGEVVLCGMRELSPVRGAYVKFTKTSAALNWIVASVWLSRGALKQMLPEGFSSPWRNLAVFLHQIRMIAAQIAAKLATSLR